MTTPRPPIRVVLAEGQAILREGLRNLLGLEPDIQVAGETADCRQVVTLLKRANPDGLVLDLFAPDFGGLEVLRQLIAGRERIPTIVLAASEEKEQVLDAFKLGARGVVFKESATKVLGQAIRAVVAEGKHWVGHEAVLQPGHSLRRVAGLRSAGARSTTFGLTKRELEILAAIVSGYSNKEIARRFSISEDTVKHHVTNIFDKVGVYNRLELALFAIHHGLVRRL